MQPSLYIHIPFCKRKCVYCNFYSDIYKEGLASSYIDVLCRQGALLDIMPSSIYVGGGTPTVLDFPLLEKLLKPLEKLLREGVEFTFEANPESVNREKLKLLFDHGVNRLSIGVQSLDDRKLKKLGRLHSAGKALESIDIARKTGFENIGIDLIFGVWGERLSFWEDELKSAAVLPVKHVSCYELTYEKDTPLFGALKEKSVAPLEDDVTAAMYESAIDILSLGGFKQYEVSNFAIAGFESRHNLNYWDNAEYVGLGASAVSYINGVRSKNVSSAEEYVNRFEAGRALVESNEKLSPLRRAKETAALKIRTRAGIDFKWFKEHTGYDFCALEKKSLARLIEEDLIKYKKEGNTPTGIRLKRRGFLFCDTVSSALL